MQGSAVLQTAHTAAPLPRVLSLTLALLPRTATAAVTFTRLWRLLRHAFGRGSRWRMPSACIIAFAMSCVWCAVSLLLLWSV